MHNHLSYSDDLGKGLGPVIVAGEAHGAAEGRVISSQLIQGLLGCAACGHMSACLSEQPTTSPVRLAVAFINSTLFLLCCVMPCRVMLCRAVLCCCCAAFISRLGRTGAFNLSVSAWVPCGIMLTSLACTMGRDEDTMQVCAAGLCDGP